MVKNTYLTISSPIGVSTIGGLVTNLIPIVMAVAGVALFGLFIYGGFNWMTSTGDPQKLKKAQGIMVNAIIGIAIVASSAILTRIVGNVLGISWSIF
jgi:hypothetical protein